MNTLEAWIAAAGREAGVDPADIPAGVVLDLARDVAHGVVRPGAPVTAYLLGLAVGRGADPSEVAERLSALALAWPTAAQAEQDAVPAGQDAAPAGKGAVLAGKDAVPAVEDTRPAAEDTPPDGKEPPIG